GFGPSGETIMDYSIYDAIRAGFEKVVFIIREEFVENFREAIGKKLTGKMEVDYVFQELHSFTEGFEVPAGRTKPWGTAHAVLCAADKIQEPFAVINADDFYGSDSFKKACKFLVKDGNENIYSIIGYELIKTLSEYGTVNRGVCSVDKDLHLVSINERLNISFQNGKIICDDGQKPVELPVSTHASMNFWCFFPSVFPFTKKMFQDFLIQHMNNPKAEFFIPIVADEFIKSKKGIIKVIETSSQWFGVTYKEDAPVVKEKLLQLVADGVYPQKLW
ncbi:MAG TPA: sugar phosphate nucleotidyltransferase, partial [Chitinophagaceae bacterium]|nr:sugar phosphate nucleotidyltransferase [Chitinophagaceae bacterium]